MVTDGEGGAIVVWEDRRDPGQQNIYAQRVDADGVAQWAPDGIVVSEAPSYENQIQAISDGSGGVIVSWTDGRNGLPDIFAQRLNAAGNTLWTLDGFGVCTDAADQVESQLASDGAGGAIIAWVDGRGVRSDLYAQRISAGGSPAWAGDGIAVTDTNVSQDQQRLVPDGSGGAIVTWVDQRGGSFDIYGQYIADGLRGWGQNGVPICTFSGDADTPRSVSDGSGGVIVVWYDYRTGDANIYAQKVTGGGSLQWTANGLPICVDGGEQLFPQVTSDGFGGAVVAWDDYRNAGAGSDVFARRVDGDGMTFWTPDGVTIASAANDQTGPLLVPDGMGGAILSWWDKRYDSGDIFAQHVGSNGQLGDQVPVTITGFVAQPVDEGVELSWDVFADEPVAGYRIYRKTAVDASAVSIHEGLLGVAERKFTDRNTIGGNDYWYTLAVVLPDGGEKQSVTVAVTTPAVDLMLGQNVPNPFNPSTTISFVLPQKFHATLSIYNIEGKLVKTVADQPLGAGRHEVDWDGTDARGKAVSSGVYFYRLDAGKKVLTKKMLLLK
jgi:hypothetical protein